MLTLNNVSKNFGKFTAVENISLNMDNGLYALLAPNGAGKTTIIKMITTLLNPTEGEILYDGVNIKTMGAAYRELLGYLPQDFGYYKNNTPKQYLSYLAALKGVPKKETAEKIDYLLEMVGLSENADKKMKKFSGGMIQRVGIAQAMLNDPKILILDEPTAGLDPKERVRFRNIISVLSKDRIVILSTHIVSDIESIANQVILIRDKHIYKMDSVANICNELSGKVFEMQVSDKEYEKMEEKYIVLSARQEKGYMTIRVFDEADDGTDNDNKVSVSPNLEDVFLVNYN
ncbi:MAG: ABC transporter ATP-binding protein [Eubacterium sp.]|jgi:ABC-2 type transport system ATP-binding protein|uniref:ABC transporter ATP-binding protein n=1 Tax=uncultured Eubacterium sp. TaxID=165185 RepID=UPI0011C92458|nr:ABC transporter ATP-binding protein [uncultured Eubacterium sp.]MEE0294855.1 ABC transporter ATP-binding protein [Eubacterium sp.]